MAMADRLLTVVETPEFLRRARSAGMSDADRAEVVDQLAADPAAGVELGGGLRKVRIARKGGGKSGGLRVLHFYREEGLPVFLLTVFAKNERANITAKDRAELVGLCDLIAKAYGKT